VRVAADVCTPDVFANAERFFSVNSPLLMFGIKNGSALNAAVIDWLAARGYALYRLVSRLRLLVPLASANELDAFSTNLFACKPDRADVLEGEGLLVRQVQPLASLPGVNATGWQECLRPWPYAAGRIAAWMEAPQKPKDWEVYWMALNLFALSRSARDPAERYAALLTALGVLTELVRERATLPRLLSLCRVLIELDKRESAVGLLNQICTLLNTGLRAALDEPALVLADRYAELDPGDREADWIIAMVLEQRECLRAFSTFFTGDESLQALEEIQASGFGGAGVERRIALIRERFQGAI
jgi:hypothetical protein